MLHAVRAHQGLCTRSSRFAPFVPTSAFPCSYFRMTVLWMLIHSQTSRGGGMGGASWRCAWISYFTTVIPPHCGCHPPLPATSYRLAWCTWEWAATRGRSGPAAGEFSSPIHSNVRHFRRFCSVLQPLSYIGIIAALSGSVLCRPPLARSATCLPLFVLCRLVLLLLISAGSVYCTCKLLLWFSLHGEA